MNVPRFPGLFISRLKSIQNQRSLIYSQYTTCRNEINEEENIKNAANGKGDINTEMRRIINRPNGRALLRYELL